jgi:hypothetical protein
MSVWVAGEFGFALCFVILALGAESDTEKGGFGVIAAFALTVALVQV